VDKSYAQKYYDFEKNHWWFRVRLKIIEDHVAKISSNKPLRILNIGVASGQTSVAFSRFGEVISVENDSDLYKFCKERNLNVINASITRLPFSDSAFDLVCAFDVIEHVEDDKKAISEMYRVCKKNGVLFITVPAFTHLWSRHDEINHHYRRYRMTQLIRLFKEFPGKIIRKTYFNTFFYFPIWLYRKYDNHFHNGKESTKSDFEVINNSFTNNLAFLIFSIERFFLKFLRMPFGVSLMIIYRKDG